MKKLAVTFIASSVSILALSLPALAKPRQSAGVFEYEHEIGIYGYQNKKGCLADRGQWGEGICSFKSVDTVTIQTAEKGFNVKVDTVGTNNHTCSFEALGEIKGQKEIVAKEEDCELTVLFKTANSVAISSTEGCSKYCGANMSLNIEIAKRQAPKKLKSKKRK